MAYDGQKEQKDAGRHKARWNDAESERLVVTAQYCVVRGYALASLAVVGPVDYLWLVFAALIGFVAFGEVPTIGVILGSVVIAGGGVVLAFADPASKTAAAP